MDFIHFNRRDERATRPSVLELNESDLKRKLAKKLENGQLVWKMRYFMLLTFRCPALVSEGHGKRKVISPLGEDIQREQDG